MGIQEGDYLATYMLSSQETCPNQSGSLLCTQDKRLYRQLGYILLQLLAQEVCKMKDNIRLVRLVITLVMKTY